MRLSSKFLRYIKQNQEIFGNNLFLEYDRTKIKNDNSTHLEKFDSQICQCQRTVAEEDTKNIVHEDVNSLVDIIFVTSISEQEEGLVIEPIIEKESDLFDKILNAINLSKADVVLYSILKSCVQNNNILSSRHLCESLLIKQLSIIKPKLIVALGNAVVSTLLKIDKSVNDLRNKLYKFNKIDFIVTYHPSELLDNPNLKKPTWEDFQLIRDKYLQAN